MTNPDEENAPFIEITMLEYNAMIQYPAEAEVSRLVRPIVWKLKPAFLF